MLVIMYIIIENLNIPNAQAPVQGANTQAIPPKAEEFVAICQYCGWEKTYSDKKGRNRGMAGHLGKCDEYLRSQQKPDINALVEKARKRVF